MSASPNQQQQRRQSRRERNLEFLRQQIRQDLEQEAALKGESISSTDSQLIQETAEAMVQAAQHAKSVVKSQQAAPKLVPMTASQIAALSQQQAAEIVSYQKRRHNNNNNNNNNNSLSTTKLDHDTQVQIQAQALDHAYTQAQMQAGIFQGDDTGNVTESPTGMVLQAPVAAGARNVMPPSESTPLLPGTSQGTDAITTLRHSSWLRKLNAGILLSVVVILVVHYTHQSLEYQSQDIDYDVYGMGNKGSGAESNIIRAPMDGGMRKSSSQLKGATLLQEQESDAIQNDESKEKGAAVATSTPKTAMDRVAASTSPVARTGVQTKDKHGSKPTKHNAKQHDPKDAETVPTLGATNDAARRPDVDAAIDTPSTPTNNVVAQSPPPAPTSVWSKMASIFTPVANVAMDIEYNSDGDNDGNTAEANHSAGIQATSVTEAATNAASDPDVVEQTPSNIVSIPADPQVSEEYFAGLLVDHEAFFFPFDTSAAEKNKKHRFLRQGQRILHHHRNHHHHHHKDTKASVASVNDSMPWGSSLNKKSESKDAAAVSEYYRSKSSTILMGDKEAVLTPLDLSLDWETDVARRKVLGETYSAIADLIDQHYRQAYAMDDNGTATRRLSKKKKKSAASEMDPVNFDPDFTWITDSERGRELGRLYGQLSNTIQDHCKEMKSGNSNEDPDESNDLVEEKGRAVAQHYRSKSAAIQNYYDSNGGIPANVDGVAADTAALDTAQDGHMVEDYYQAVYDPVNYKQDLLALLPATNPNKVYGEWGHDWRKDREHGKALDEYWAQYNSVMDDYYKKQGDALSKYYQDYYNGQFSKTHV